MIKPFPKLTEVELSDAAPKFCSFCGGKLVQKIIKDDFDSKTGNQKFALLRECENKNSWKFWQYHEKFISFGFGWHSR